MGAVGEQVVIRGWAGRGESATGAVCAWADRTAVLGVGAAAVRRVSISIPAARDPSTAAAGNVGGAGTDGPAHARRAVSRGAARPVHGAETRGAAAGRSRAADPDSR